MTQNAGEAGGPAAGRMDADVAPRAANQGRTEPIPPSSAHDDGEASADASTGRPAADPAEPATETVEGARQTATDREPVQDAAEGRPAVAVPGKPDGEVDTRN